jgi:hypothetical protein
MIGTILGFSGAEVWRADIKAWREYTQARVEVWRDDIQTRRAAMKHYHGMVMSTILGLHNKIREEKL